MKKYIRNILRPIYYLAEALYSKMLEMVYPTKIKDYKKIPIIINNRNRLTFLSSLIDNLEKRGYENIYIIDNDSSYPPLLEYYKKINHKIFFLKENIGYLALWQTDLYKKFIRDYYVYTDPDVIPIDECPDDFLDFFRKCLQKHKFAKKVGFSLKIDDLPDHYKNKDSVISWESQFFKNKTDDGLYRAHIDTTFALYRPWAKGGSNDSHITYRTAYPFEARHMPWYVNSKELPEEELYYIEHAKQSTFWTKES